MLSAWIRRLNIAKMSIVPEAIYKFPEIATKISMMSFAGIEKSTLKFLWNPNRP